MFGKTLGQIFADVIVFIAKVFPYLFAPVIFAEAVAIGAPDESRSTQTLVCTWTRIRARQWVLVSIKLRHYQRTDYLPFGFMRSSVS